MTEGQPISTEQEVRDFITRCEPSGELLQKLDYVKALMGLPNTATAIFQVASMGEEMLRYQVQGATFWAKTNDGRELHFRWPID